MLIILILAMFLYIVCSCLNKSKDHVEKMGNISGPNSITPFAVVFQRYARYDPYYFRHPMDECYLGVHHDGTLIRSRGSENWNGKKFILIPTQNRTCGNPAYYIKSALLQSFLYISDNNKPLTQTVEKEDCSNLSKPGNLELHDRFIWEVSTDQIGNVTLWNPSTKRYLAISCKDDNVYSRVDYQNDCLFKGIVSVY